MLFHNIIRLKVKQINLKVLRIFWLTNRPKTLKTTPKITKLINQVAQEVKIGFFLICTLLEDLHTTKRKSLSSSLTLTFLTLEILWSRNLPWQLRVNMIWKFVWIASKSNLKICKVNKTLKKIRSKAKILLNEDLFKYYKDLFEI